MARHTLTNKNTPVPAFDTGSCLWSNTELLDAPIDFECQAKPLRNDGPA